MKKRILILGLFTALNVQAEVTISGSCGTNCIYEIDGTTLTARPDNPDLPAYIDKEITRTCDDYSCYTDAPWRASGVTNIVIEKGIDTVGVHAFEDMPSVTEVSLPQGLKRIDSEAFHWTSLTHIDLPSTLNFIGDFAFSIDPLESINGIPDGVTKIFAGTFESSIKNFIVPAGVTEIAPDTFGSRERNGALIENLYCNETIADQCDAAVQWKRDLGNEVNVITYKKDGNQIFYNNKWYNNPNDILSGDYIKKRIYTIEEATKVSKPTGNTVRIKYR
ncbi:MAG: leucine-rich repeat domain-containing protein [Alphaproteobacteria bacterium]|nr:leucine-rich repeat domain-containing protein [Alphaproteobacteria bacterium]